MSEKPAQNKPYEKISGEREDLLTQSSWTSVPKDDVYERRIFELESHIERLEFLLTMAEAENSKYRRQSCQKIFLKVQSKRIRRCV